MKLTFNFTAAIPGAGKTTFTKGAMQPEDAYICPDDLRAQLSGGDPTDQTRSAEIFRAIVPSLIKDAAAQGKHIWMDATNTTRKARAPLAALAKSLGYLVRCYVMDVPYETCVARNAARDRVVPIHVLERMRNQWQEPSHDEGIDEVWYVAPDGSVRSRRLDHPVVDTAPASG